MTPPNAGTYIMLTRDQAIAAEAALLFVEDKDETERETLALLTAWIDGNGLRSNG